MKQEEIKILENVEKEIREKEDYCFQQMSFCRKHKFEMEVAALEYRRDAYHQCRLEIMDAIDKLKNINL